MHLFDISEEMIGKAIVMDRSPALNRIILNLEAIFGLAIIYNGNISIFISFILE